MAVEVQTEGVVLRRRPYGESSLILSLLTPELGQQQFMLKGAQKSARGQGPAADLFRRLELHYRPSSRSDLHTLRHIEVLDDFAGIARYPRHFRYGGWLCRFLLLNSVPEQPSPQLYRALVNTLRRFSAGQPEPPLAAVVSVSFVLLSEQGMLPELPAGSQRLGLQQTLAYALLAEQELPDFTPAAWGALANWLGDFLGQIDLARPGGWDPYRD